MKKILLFSILTLSLIACNNDDNNNTQNPTEETTTMKLKEFRGITTSKYFYHENGFVDSIAVIGGGMIQNNIYKKFIYDSQNNLQTIEILVKSYSDQTIAHVKETFEYSNLDQISAKITLNQISNSTSTTNFTYNAEGYLDNSGQIFLNGNLIQAGTIMYTFDDKKNPFYEMLPVAYNRINITNKNNQILSKTEIETLETINWTYNQNGYPISFQKSPILPDDVDYAEYIYY